MEGPAGRDSRNHLSQICNASAKHDPRFDLLIDLGTVLEGGAFSISPAGNLVARRIRDAEMPGWTTYLLAVEGMVPTAPFEVVFFDGLFEYAAYVPGAWEAALSSWAIKVRTSS